MTKEHKPLEFDSFCNHIGAAYNSLRHHMSWSFLYTPQSTFRSSQQLLFVGLNPAGKEGIEYPESKSCEHGNDYLYGVWNQTKKGESGLQKQVQKLFEKISVSMNGKPTCQAMMNTSLAANYIPFRSPSWSTLKNKKHTLDFASRLWSDILDYVQPRAIVCISLVPYKEINKILRSKGFQIAHDTCEKIGWGKINYRVSELERHDRTIILAQLPHLSHYQVFSREECRPEIKKLTDKIASVLDANAF